MKLIAIFPFHFKNYSTMHGIAHWSRGGQKVLPQNFQAKSTTKRFGQIYERKYNKNLIIKSCTLMIYEKAKNAF